MMLAVCFAVGWYACYLFNCWGAVWRVCCREHYLTHSDCRCPDCVRDRAVQR
jgi:hypothetical protein